MRLENIVMTEEEIKRVGGKRIEVEEAGIYSRFDDVFLQFERVLLPNGKTLVPRTVLFPKKIKELSDQEKKEMINLLEKAKEIFK